jgi:hypothetical protein
LPLAFDKPVEPVKTWGVSTPHGLDYFLGGPPTHALSHS